MIVVDIQVPVLDRIYDFELDEEREVGDLMKEIVSLIEEKESLRPAREKKRYLYAIRRACVLKENERLAEQGIRNGDRLILI